MAENEIQEKQTSRVKLYAVALIYTFSIGFSFLAIKKCVPYADSLTILAYRYDFALLGVLVWFGVCRLLGKRQEAPKDRPKSKLYRLLHSSRLPYTSSQLLTSRTARLSP